MKTAASNAERGTAPDIADDYPSGGERLGPAWQLAWDMIGERGWCERAAIAKRVSTERGDIAAITVENLIRQATRAGLLEQQLAMTRPAEIAAVGGRGRNGSRRKAWVRRPPAS